ncbi:peroxiredoxin-like family protein [Agromyces sp. ZXT2-6]|uniref:peroxiredoxin-like family protein n=1 Tax=Agromyces sp. ZXT2-6 TaxID=3461153 RepID=UPI0040551556
MTAHLRRVYIESTGVLALASVVVAVALASSDPGWFLAAVPGIIHLAYFALLMARGATGGHVERVAVPAAGALALIGAVVLTADVLAGVVAAVPLAAWLGYDLWFTRQHRPAETIAVGEPLPEFPLTTPDGEEVSSEVFTHRPHVILFIRGNWCPFCMAQVRSIAEQYRELERRGVSIVFVSPQSAEDTAELADRFDVPMAFYVDRDGRAAELLDLTQRGGRALAVADRALDDDGDTVVPTAVITDADGRVVWVHHSEDHRVRPEPSTFLEVIDREGIAVAR